MYTIFDYLKYYKNKSMEELKINNIDILLFTILTYLPIESYKGKKTLNEFIIYSNKYKDKLKKGTMNESAFKLLDLVKSSKRYSKLEIYNPLFIKDNNTQFGGITYRIDNNVIISFKGTDNSLIGWIENIRISYKYPTYTQDLAIKYMNDNINLFDSNIYLSGHSKGGNLALVCAYELNPISTRSLKKVLNFDGPGLRYSEFNTARFKKISSKIENIIPTGSMVGVLQENKKYIVVKSNELAWKEHNPSTWLLFGEYFIEGKLSHTSENLHESSTRNIRNLDYKKMENAFETLIEKIGKEYKNDLKFNYNDFKNIYNNMKEIDPEIANYLGKVLESIFNTK